jgi:hypothetical protein
MRYEYLFIGVLFALLAYYFYRKKLDVRERTKYLWQSPANDDDLLCFMLHLEFTVWITFSSVLALLFILKSLPYNSMSTVVTYLLGG